MKKYLTILLLVITFQLVAQNYPITGINISLPTNPDSNTTNWGSGTSMFTITSTAKAENGRVAPHVMESKILVTIKKGGAKVCGSYTVNTAPESNFNTLTKVWSGINAAALLGQDCVLTPGDYELCVQFFGYGPVGMAPLSEEKCKPFSISEKEQQTFQPPQVIAPADGTVMSEADVKKPITFRWIPVIPRPQDPVTYRLTVWQLMQGQTGTQAMKVNQPLITKDVDNITQVVINNLVSGSCLPPYLCSFIWNVQALNHEGKPIGENNGTSGALVFNFRNDRPADNPEEKVGGEACKDFSVDFMEDRKIYRGDSISSSLNNDSMEKRKIYRGDSITYECTITNKYRGDELAYKPKTFRIKLNSDLVIAVVDNVAKGWTRTPSKFPPGSSQIKWTNNSGDIPNGKTKLGSICFEHIKTGPITVIYEWLNKDKKVICSESIDLARSPVGTSGSNTITIGDGKKFDTQPSNPSPIPHTIAFKIVSPTDNQPATTCRPTFEWKIEKPEEGVSYSIVVKEIPEKGEPESGRIVLERSSIHENTLPYPQDAPNLDSSKSYGWQVSMIKNGKLVADSPFTLFNLIKIHGTAAEKIELISPIGSLVGGDGKEGGITFKWTASNAKGPFSIKIVEIKSDQSPDAAMQKNTSHFEKKNIDITTFKYPPFAPKFEKGKKYAWGIEANDNGQGVGDNNGKALSKSGPGSFTLAACGTINFTSVLQCVGNNTYTFTLTCQNAADPVTDPNCIVVVNAISLLASSIPVTTSSLPLSIQPGQTSIITGQFGPIFSSTILMFSVAFTSPNGGGTYSPAFTLPVPPLAPGAITGLGTICQGQTGLVYSISAVSDATSYIWSVPAGASITAGQGTTSITLTAGTAGGTVCVSAVNACGTSIPGCITLTVNPLPVQPGTITGITAPCVGSSQNYSVPNVSGVTYTWNFPAGWTQTVGGITNSVTVTAGTGSGNITVTPSNTCGNGPARTLAVTPATPPDQPGFITGPSNVCAGQAGLVYSISAVSGATSYNWVVPAGAIITAQGTTSITVTFGAISGNVCVNAINSCGTSMQSCKTISFQPTPPAPTAGAGTGIQFTQFTAVWTPVAGASGYYLDVATNPVFSNYVPGYGNLNVGAVTTYIVTGLSCNTPYFYRVRAIGVCGSSSTNSNFKKVNTLVSTAPIANPGTGIQATQFTANWAAVSGASYKLDVSTNPIFGTMIFGYYNLSVGTATTYNVTGLSCNTAYYYRIRSIDACGGPSANSNTIPVTTSIATPQPPVAIAATGNMIQPNQFTANWSAVTGATGYYLDIATNPGFTSFVTGFNNKSTGAVTSYTATGLSTNNTTSCPVYYFRVRVIGTCAISANSNTITVNTFQTVPHGSWIKGPGHYSFNIGAFGTTAEINACPGQLITLTIEVWGAGGGGCSGSQNFDNRGGDGGSGGGGGGYAISTLNVIVPTTPGVVKKLLVEVGSGGIGGASPGDEGSQGGASTVKEQYNVVYIYATGGFGGNWATSSNIYGSAAGFGGFGGYWATSSNIYAGVGGYGPINTLSGSPGTIGVIVTGGCNGGAGGLGGAGGGPDRTGPGYFNDGGNGGHGGYFHNLILPTCTDHGQNYLLSPGVAGGNGRVVLTW